jgi:hypothetical protein
MSATSLVTFDAGTRTVALVGRGYSGVRLQTAAEFKRSRGLKGQEARRHYNEYLRLNGRANTGGLAAAMSTGELLVTGFRDYEKSGRMNVTFMRKDRIKDPVKKEAAAPAVADAVLQKIIAAGLGPKTLDEARAWIVAQ